MFQLVFSDLDDTFLNTDKTISEKNLEALLALKNRGIHFVPCTGRSYETIPAAALEQADYAIAVNGACIYEQKGNKLLFERPIEQGLLAEVLAEIRAHKISCTFDVFNANSVYTVASSLALLDRLGKFREDMVHIKAGRREFLGTELEMLSAIGPIQKVTMYWETEADKEALIALLSERPELSFTSSHPLNFELMAAGVDKGSALSWLANYLGVDLADCLAFGDNLNDCEMLSLAGRGVCPANAHEAAKEVADVVLDKTNDEAAVGDYILSLL